jgi:hypothetical protein
LILQKKKRRINKLQARKTADFKWHPILGSSRCGVPFEIAVQGVANSSWQGMWQWLAHPVRLRATPPCHPQPSPVLFSDAPLDFQKNKK